MAKSLHQDLQGTKQINADGASDASEADQQEKADELIITTHKIKEIQRKLSDKLNLIEDYTARAPTKDVKNLKRESRLLKVCIDKVKPVAELCADYQNIIVKPPADVKDRTNAVNAVRKSIRMFQQSGIELKIEKTFERIERMKLSELPPPDLYSSHAHRQMEARLKTFDNWPLNNARDPIETAKLGFYFTGEDDMIKCFSCGLRLVDLQASDSLSHLHRQYSPHCPVVSDSVRADLSDS